ncbi:hypothetical protein [Mycolicibacterium setense]
MSIVHAQLLPEFMRGDDVVMLAMVTVGTTHLHVTLNEAVQHRWSRLDLERATQEFCIVIDVLTT